MIALLATTVMDFNNPYMQWYRVITWCFITPLLHQDLMRFHSTTSTTKLLVRQFRIKNHFQIKVNLNCVQISHVSFSYTN